MLKNGWAMIKGGQMPPLRLRKETGHKELSS